MTRATSSHLAVLGAALLFSTGGAAIKATALDAWQVAGLRSGIAAVGLLVCIPATRRHWNSRTLLVGVGYDVTLLAFVVANKLTTAANAIFLQSTGPLYIALLAPWLLREHVRRRDIIFMLVLGSGRSLFFLTETPAQASAPDPAHRQPGRRIQRVGLGVHGDGASLDRARAQRWRGRDRGHDPRQYPCLRVLSPAHVRPQSGRSCRSARGGVSGPLPAWTRVCPADLRTPECASRVGLAAPAGRTGLESCLDLAGAR